MMNNVECDDSGVFYDTSLLPLALLLAKLSLFFRFLLINTMNFNVNNNLIVQDLKIQFTLNCFIFFIYFFGSTFYEALNI